MSDCEKTKEQLMDELEALRAELATLKSLRSPREQHKLIVDDAACDRQISLPELLNALQKLIHEQTSYLNNINAHLHEEIAERKLLEKKLAYSENKIRSILEAMTDVILIVNLQGEDLNSIEIAPMNNQALDAVRSEIVNQTINRFFQESLNSDWLQRVRQVATSRKTDRLDYSVSVGSQLLWFSAMISPINETAVTWVARDISERKLAEAKLQQLNTELEQRILERTIALRQSEAHLQEAQKFAKLGSWEFDVFTNQVIWSPEIYQIYGLDTQDAEFTPEQVWHKFSPEDRERLKNHLKNAIQCRQSYATDLKFMRADGSCGYIFAKGEPICNERGEVVRIVGIMIDITERKQSEIMLINAEKRWKFVFDNVQLVVVEFDINGVIKYINPFFLNLTDYTEAEVLGRLWLETFVPCADWQQFENVFSEKLGSQNHYYYENRILTKAGSERFIVGNNTVLKDSSGNTIGIFSIGEDITERKRIEEALRESEESLQIAQRVAHVGSWDYNISTNKIKWSEEMFRIFGRDLVQSEPSYQEFLQIIYLEDREKLDRLVTQAIVTGEPYEIEHRIIRKDGSIRYLLGRGEAQLDAEGNTIGLYGTALDITERKATETALQESKQQYQTLVENSPNIIERFDTELRHLYVSPSLTKITGISAEVFLGKTCRELGFPEAMINTWETAAETLLTTGKKQTIEFETLTLNGTRSFEMEMAPELTSQGIIESIVCISRDVTDRKQAEKALRDSQHLIQRITDTNPNLLYIYDLLEQRNIYANRSVAEMLGYGTETIKLMGANLLPTICHPEDLPMVYEAMQKCATLKDNEFVEIDYRVRNARGEWRWLHSRDTVFMRTANGEVKQTFGTSADITDRKLAEETLQRVNQELQERVAELKQRNAEMFLLNGIGDYLQSCLTVAEACATIGTLSQPLFPESGGAIFMMTNSRDLLEMVTSWGNPLYSETIFVPKDCWALRRGRLHWIGDERHDLFCNHIDHQHPPVESLCMPMIAQGETIGLLYLCASKPHQMTENRQLLARRVAEQLGLAIANITLREKLVNQSIRDALTGLFNRRYLEEFLTKEIPRADRNQYSVGMIMLDLDRFREFNNTLGHDAGDLVLKEIGKLLNNMIRASDVACRYGGEEMTIILPEASLEGTYQKAEEIRKAIEKLQLNYQGKKMTSITASLGVASYPDRGKTGFAVIQAADAALYRAKAAGRNQVIVADR
ncbi:PAS domain S-box protein [Microcoleus sp. CAWBG640]|uniref:sensor domain-containing diguanylate cyclase n=1 Tax=Microcoleus sp. CAWBG640 TaxID=2841653 RepID=UPI00312B583E